MLFKFTNAIILGLLASAGSLVQADKAKIVGTDELFNLTATTNSTISQTISHSGASYIAVHFASLNLPEGESVIVRSPTGSKSYEYTGNHPSGFYASYIPGDTALVEYKGTSKTGDKSVFSIDKFARGFADNTELMSVCGEDNTRPAMCYANSNPTQYTKGKAVARLLIGGTSLCTGWLLGSEGHLVTNNHCIGSASAASDVQVELSAEGACDDSCNDVQLGCPGTIVSTSSKLVTTNKSLDYALIKLNLNSGASLSSYGYLKFRSTGATLGEKIYIPQHPNGNAKRIANVVDDGSDAAIDSLSESNSCGSDQVGYAADTAGGASGSPVLSTKDNLVIALHHCGGCPNSAIKVQKIVADMKSKRILPANAV